jgi:hypothetical protein
VNLDQFGAGQPFELAPGAEVPIHVEISWPLGGEGVVEILQEIYNEEARSFLPVGGYTFDFAKVQ